MGIFSSLKRDQKEAIGLLQIGTFLEYFDLMLYVHMAILLNELFFPKTDPKTEALLSAFAFCSTFVLRPFGALLFGYIGDHIGRKTTVIFTTLMMAFSCVMMATLPTYAQIGIAASWIVTLCRILQGISSMGEIMGAEIYLTEITKPPIQYPVVSLIRFAASFGAMVALAVASLVTLADFNWRNAFWIGAGVALIGSVARTRLRETPDFVDMKKRVTRALEEAEREGLGAPARLLNKSHPLWREKTNQLTTLAFFLIYCAWPLCFYFSYVHCGSLLKNQFGYSAAQVIHQNLLVALVEMISVLFFSYLSFKIHPLKILKYKFIIFSIFIVVAPVLLNHMRTGPELFLFQAFSIFFSLYAAPASSILIIHFPIFRRFTYTSLMYALSRAIIHAVTSFGLVYMCDLFGSWGLWVIMLPILLGFYIGLKHFESLEKERPSPAFSPA